MNRDSWRSACLLFSDELADGEVTPDALDRPEVAQAVIARQVPSPFSRWYQAREIRSGGLRYDRDVADPFVAARAAVLGPERAAGPPRFLVRIDGFPHHLVRERPDLGTETFARVHAILSDAGVPYLLGVLPWVPESPLDPDASGWRLHDDDERALLGQLRREGVAFGVHGLDHRSRVSRADRRSELRGLRTKALTERLDAAAQTLRDAALHADVFVAPWDRFDADQYAELASRWDVVTGGPATVRTLGFHATPVWRGDAVYLPAYPPLVGAAGPLVEGIEHLASRRTGLWTPVVLDWAQLVEAGWQDLQRLAQTLAGRARPWDEFFAAIAFSRRQAASIMETT